MRTPLSARNSLFLFVRTHAQLQRYLQMTETRRAANQSGPGLRGGKSPRAGTVVEIRPSARSTRGPKPSRQSP